MLVNSLIDANTDGVIMMLDWAKAYDLVDHEHLENVLFCMGCDGIGLQRLMNTAKGFTLCFHCKQTHQEQHCVGQQPD